MPEHKVKPTRRMRAGVWGITQSADFIDRLKLSVTKLTIPYKDILLDNMQLPAGTYFYQLQTKKR